MAGGAPRNAPRGRAAPAVAPRPIPATIGAHARPKPTRAPLAPRRAQQAAFAAEWQSTKERVAEDLREHAMLRRGLHMALTIKPTKKRK